MKKAVIFDMDGVLIESEPIYQKRRESFFEQYGINLTVDQQLDFVGSNPSAMMKILFPNNKIKQVEFLIAYKDYVEKYPIDYTLILNSMAIPLLRQLHNKGIKLAVASSGGEKEIKQVLKETNLVQYFETYVSGEWFEESKPHPAIYKSAAQKLNCHPNECLAVEDSYYGVLAASQADIEVILLRNEYYHIEAPQAHAEIDNLIKVLDFI